MAAFASQTQRRGMLGWGIGNMLPVADSLFDGVDRQLFLALPGQYDIGNTVIVVAASSLLVANWLAPSLHVCLALGFFLWPAH